MKKVILILLVLLISGCSLCRYKAVNDAEVYQAQGYQVQITTYKQGWDGLIWGMGIWTHHAQARVFEDGWQWVGEFGGLQKTPTFSIAGDVVNWKLEVYKAALKEKYGADIFD